MTDASRFRPAAGPAARRLLAAASIAVLAASPALAAEPGLSLHGGWMRMLIAARPAGGYFTLDNTGAASRTLTGAASPACGSIMLHQSVHHGSQEQMLPVKQVVVPAHGAVSFAPGGYHLMCMHPGAAMHPGATVTVTLRFADGGTLAAPFAVKGALGK